jgi:hypothetical protein
VRCLRCHLRIFSRRPLGNITPQVTQTIEPSGIFNSKMPMYRTYTAFVFLITARGFSSERWCWNYYFIFCSAAPLFEGEYDVRRCDDAREEMKTVDCPANRSDQPHGFWELIGSKTKMTPYLLYQQVSDDAGPKNNNYLTMSSRFQDSNQAIKLQCQAHIQYSLRVICIRVHVGIFRETLCPCRRESYMTHSTRPRLGHGLRNGRVGKDKYETDADHDA